MKNLNGLKMIANKKFLNKKLLTSNKNIKDLKTLIDTPPRILRDKLGVTGKVKKGSKAAKRRKSYCARSLGQLKRSSTRNGNN